MKLKKGKFLGAIVLSLFLLSSCRSLRNTNTLFLSEYDKFADTAKTIYVANKSNIDPGYKIKPFDQIALRNLQNPEGGLSSSVTQEGTQAATSFRVNNDGIVTLPAIGAVEIKGLTIPEAQKKLQELYGKSLLKNPIIELTVVNYKVTLLGEVAKVGNVALERDNVDLVEVIGKSGGFSTIADASKIKIIRGDRKSPEIIYVNLKNLNSLGSDKLVLQNNDIIYVPPRRLSNINEGFKSYLAIIQPAMLVLNALILINTIRR